MAFREELEQSGAWLFRYRSFGPPLLLIPLILAAEPVAGGRSAGLPRPWVAAGLGVAALGLMVRALVVGHAPRGTSGKNRSRHKAEALTTTGLYSVCRHPLYLGNVLLWLGPALAVGRWWPVVTVALACWLYHERIIYAEEEFLRQAFGPRYLDWADRTPAMLPRPGLWVRPALPFSARTVLRLEYYALVSTAALFTALEAGTVFRQTGRPGLDRSWLTGFAIILVAGAGLRFLQRHTKVLDVEGR